jgi:pimeloyl-ACP methyl ester carboxylesterase
LVTQGDPLYPRIDPVTVHELAGRLHPAVSPTGAYPLAAPPDLRTALIYTTEDVLFTPEWERFAARELLDVEPVEIPGGHFPMIENPDALADVLDWLITDGR